MSNCEDCQIHEVYLNGLLNEFVCLNIHSCRGFVKNENLGLRQYCSSNTEELTLTYAKVLAILFLNDFFLKIYWELVLIETKKIFIFRVSNNISFSIISWYKKTLK